MPDYVQARSTREQAGLRFALSEDPGLELRLGVLSPAVRAKLLDSAAVRQALSLTVLDRGGRSAYATELKAQLEQYERSVDSALGAEWKDLAPGTGLRLLELRGDEPELRRLRVTTATARHDVEIPRWELLGLERKVIADRVLKALGNPRGTDPVLVFGGDLDYSTNDLFRDRLSARTFDQSPRFASDHVRNLRELQRRSLSAETTAFFNLIPESDVALTQMGLTGSRRRWRRARARFDAFAQRKGIAARTPERAAVIQTLQEGTADTLVIAAHGEKGAIYFPDGSKLTVEDILALPLPPSGKRPIVILVACETGKDTRDATVNIAQALLYRGRATSVLAPTTTIPADRSSVQFLEQLFAPGGASAASPFHRVPPTWQLWVLHGTADRSEWRAA